MSIKLLLLYPQPADAAAFDRYYVEEHLPLMRRLVGNDIALPTYKTQPRGAALEPYYRVAEIVFPSRGAFDDFVASGRAKTGWESACRVSTGGRPISLVCVAQDEAP